VSEERGVLAGCADKASTSILGLHHGSA
jgi:hypothetical protein